MIEMRKFKINRKIRRDRHQRRNKKGRWEQIPETIQI
jgi:hypothetical protein